MCSFVLFIVWCLYVLFYLPLTTPLMKILFFRLQTGMRGAFGKPQGTVARVDIGQIIISIRTKDNHRASAVEAFRRAKFKFPGRQKVCTHPLCYHCECYAIDYMQIFVSNKWGFTKWNRDVYKNMRQEGRLTTDGVNVQYRPEKGPLQAWMNRRK